MELGKGGTVHVLRIWFCAILFCESKTDEIRTERPSTESQFPPPPLSSGLSQSPLARLSEIAGLLMSSKTTERLEIELNRT